MDITSPKSCTGSRRRRAAASAFTLIEVMIAMGIFFMAIFAILGLVSQNIRNARSLQEPPVDPTLILGQLSLTNRMDCGDQSGDFGELYPGYEWTARTSQAGTNGLQQVDLAVYNRKKGDEQHISVLFYRPDTPACN